MSAQRKQVDPVREARDLRRELKRLTTDVRIACQGLDDVMRAPEGIGRGKLVATIVNALEMSNDRARYFGLGEDYRKDAKRAVRAGSSKS